MNLVAAGNKAVWLCGWRGPVRYWWELFREGKLPFCNTQWRARSSLLSGSFLIKFSPPSPRRASCQFFYLCLWKGSVFDYSVACFSWNVAPPSLSPSLSLCCSSQCNSSRTLLLLFAGTMFCELRGAWRYRCFPEPFSYFLHEQAFKIWRSPLHAVFIEMSKERLEKSERTPPVSWCPWALAYSCDRPYNFPYLSAVSKNRRFAVLSQLWGVIWQRRAFLDQQCQFLTRNKSLSSENKSNCSMTSECVCTDSILPRGAGLGHGRCKQSIFSLSIFSILVERLSF